MILIVAFKKSVGWGLICLLIAGIGPLVFTIKNWKDAKKAFVIALVGGVIGGIGGGISAAAAKNIGEDGKDFKEALETELEAPPPAE